MYYVNWDQAVKREAMHLTNNMYVCWMVVLCPSLSVICFLIKNMSCLHISHCDIGEGNSSGIFYHVFIGLIQS